jgi:hypothetical protein
MLPSFIIIGAMKSGTTSLFHYLASDPQLVPSSIKEPNFFVASKNWEKGLNWYKGLFIGGGNLAFEASTNYTKRHHFPGVPEQIYQVIPKIKLIYLLRDPIERLISHYVYRYAHGWESRSLSEAVNENSGYIKTSSYYYQIQAYLEYFNKNQILILKSDDLRKKPEETLGRIYDFLHISKNYDKKVLETQYNKSSQKRRPCDFEIALQKKFEHPLIKQVIKKCFSPFRKNFDRPTLSPADRDTLREIFSPDVNNLRRFSGLEFSNWSL